VNAPLLQERAVTVQRQQPGEAVIVRVTPGGQLASQLTAQDVRAMRVRLNDLRSELQDAAERRIMTARQLRDADPSARAGFEARLQVLDTRIMSIENEITTIVQRMGTAPSEALATQPRFNPGRPMGPDVIVPVFGILGVFLFLPLSIGISRFLWKRANNAPRSALSDPAVNQRLEQLQQAVDTIAIEVERISEGQRFVTKLLNEKALGSGGAEPVHASRKSALPVDAG
jgi:hypothetical protein